MRSHAKVRDRRPRGVADPGHRQGLRDGHQGHERGRSARPVRLPPQAPSRRAPCPRPALSVLQQQLPLPAARVRPPGHPRRLGLGRARPGGGERHLAARRLHGRERPHARRSRLSPLARTPRRINSRRRPQGSCRTGDRRSAPDRAWPEAASPTTPTCGTAARRTSRPTCDGRNTPSSRAPCGPRRPTYRHSSTGRCSSGWGPTARAVLDVA